MSELFAREVTKRAVARACAAFEFKNIQKSALDSLADVVEQYVLLISEQTRDFAEASGRAIPGIQDVMQSIEVPVNIFQM